jgi:ferredoxin--NADP+ reductase
MNSSAKIPLFKTEINALEEIAKDVFVVSFPRKEDFVPGQMLAIALKPQDQPRLYSIASGLKDDNYSILFNVQHQGYLTPKLSRVAVGDALFVSKPFGSFFGDKDQAVWIAAGTGIAPFISMLKSGLAENKTLIHGGRAEDSFYFSSALESHMKEKYIRCSSLLKEKAYYNGRITSYLRQIENLDLGTKYSICGSSEFVVDVRDILIDRGVPYQQIMAEIYF